MNPIPLFKIQNIVTKSQKIGRKTRLFGSHINDHKVVESQANQYLSASADCQLSVIQIEKNFSKTLLF